MSVWVGYSIVAVLLTLHLPVYRVKQGTAFYFRKNDGSNRQKLISEKIFTCNSTKKSSYNVKLFTLTTRPFQYDVMLIPHWSVF